MPNVSHFELLGVKSDASSQEIKKAHKKLVFMYHPDKVNIWLTAATDKEDAVEVFKRVDEAYKTLSDSDKRRVYEATFRPLPSTTDEELFRHKWERLHQEYVGYEQRTTSPANYIIFLESQITQLQNRQSETSQQLNLLGGHISQFNLLLQTEAAKRTKHEEENRMLKAALAKSLQENAKLKSMAQQAQASPVKPTQTTNALVSQAGTFAAKPTDKLTPDGLKAVLKITQNGFNQNEDELEWYWVNLEFINNEKAGAFKDKFQRMLTENGSIKLLFSSVRNCDLSVSLSNSPAYYETFDDKEKTGMVIMRELARYVNIESTPQHFVTDNYKIIPDAELSEKFKAKFLQFVLSEDANKRPR